MHPVIAELAELDKIKTWSLIVTLFGDSDGASLTGKQIGTFLSDTGIRPQATRVALHRLKKDGWIVTRKLGREVRYRLSDHGLRETAGVSPDVYSREVKFSGGWRVCLVEEDDGLDAQNGSAIRLFRNVLMVPKQAACVSEKAFALPVSGEVPGWLLERLVPATVCERAARLADCCARYKAAPEAFSGEERVALRLLVLHHWRKMALRNETWAHIALAPGAAMARCHETATAVLAMIAKPRW